MQFGRENIDMIKLPDVLIFLHVQTPTGPNRGTAFDHIGLAATSVPAVVEKLKANGLYRPTVGREPVPGAAPPAEGQGGAGGGIAYLLGPDDVKLGIVTNREPNAPPLKGHHMHFINKQYVEAVSGTRRRSMPPAVGARPISSSAAIFRASVTA